MIARDDDIDRIMTVMSSAFDPQFGEAWNRRQIIDALTLGTCDYLLLDADGELPGEGAPAAGFCLSRRGFDEEELLLLAVDPALRRRGLAWRLLDGFLEAARARGAQRLLLEMRENNPAGALYRRYGFHGIGRRPSYYRTPSGSQLDAVTYALEIK
jgi:[ribosomal protein S18]-alanine N-acetyltransferase